ncbi:hypothetical protein HT102_05140 [Hoyosella sp. G463]|uniref:YchJ-like middle NTF2-like domain-containing protein n=2 Tax=Lolliginicoccus lacisalsi TaxID=2742202 RepID=A0A927PLY4_9ACTN|nr:hypothetical protein [Lolliginicoccus lacisalsi]
MRCPCGSGRDLDGCCGMLLSGERKAGTAEALMRSRYTAFMLGDTSYLHRTWHPTTRPRRLELDPAQEWLGLRILGAQRGSLLDSTGTVEFVAEYRYRGRRDALHERSRFTREKGQWLYVDGVFPDEA